MKKNYISFILASFIVTQSIIPADIAQVNPQQLDSYFTRLKRGIKCYWQKKPCSKQDKEIVQGTTILLLFLLLFLIRRPWITHASSDETLAIFMNIREELPNIDNIKKNVGNLEKQGKQLDFAGLLFSTLQVISEVQESKEAWNKQVELTKKPTRSGLPGETIALIAQKKGETANQIMQRLQKINARETQLKEIAKYFISKAGIHNSRATATHPDLGKIDSKTLEELGII